MQAAEAKAMEQEQLRQAAEQKTAAVHADGARRSSAFHAAVRAAVAQAQTDIEQERSAHTAEVCAPHCRHITCCSDI